MKENNNKIKNKKMKPRVFYISDILFIPLHMQLKSIMGKFKN